MKVLFLNPIGTDPGEIPLNIPLLIGVLKKHNHEVYLFNFSDYKSFEGRFENTIFFKKTTLDTEKIIQDRKKFYGDEFGKTITGCERKGSNYHQDFEKLLNKVKPDIIAVSCLSAYFRSTYEFLSLFKQKYKIPVVIGGVHAILAPEETLNFPVYDFVCTGDGENSIVELLDAIENNKPLEEVKGIWFKKNGEIIKNPRAPLTDLTTLPSPCLDLFDPLHFYRDFDGKNYKMLNYELSRGCPYSCSYCANSVIKEKHKGLGPYFRRKQINQSINELKVLINKHQFEFIRFWDENFTSLDSAYLEKYAKAYLNEINLPFLIYARVESVTEEKVQILKRMGCKTFAMGIESGNEFIRKNVLNRHMSNRVIIEKFNLVKSYGIRVSSYNMIALPYETRSRIFDTIELNRKVDPEVSSCAFLAPYKHTPIRKMCEDEGLDPNYETIASHVPQFIPKGMTRDELQGLYRTFRFYIKFPKERFDEIKLAETDDETYRRLEKEYASSYL